MERRPAFIRRDLSGFPPSPVPFLHKNRKFRLPHGLGDYSRLNATRMDRLLIRAEKAA